MNMKNLAIYSCALILASGSLYAENTAIAALQGQHGEAQSLVYTYGKLALVVSAVGAAVLAVMRSQVMIAIWAIISVVIAGLMMDIIGNFLTIGN